MGSYSTKKYPPLTPVRSPWMRRVAKDQELLRDLFQQHGSPINLLHPGPFEENYNTYKEVLVSHEVKHKIFFARKANKCLAFVKKAKRMGCGVDTASYRELKQCLESGCEAKQLVLTAAIKNERLVRLALNYDVLIILDNEDECLLVNRIAGELGKSPSVGIRISGFTYKGEKLYSRFGFDIESAAEFISHHFGPEQRYFNLQFEGFHFHLDGYSINQRGSALVQTINLADKLQSHNISTSFIDMGGGLLTNYLSDKNQWDHFWSELKKSIKGQREPITFNNNGLGYKMCNGKLQGAPDVYPFYNEIPKEQFLDEVLSYQNEKRQTVASLLRERDIEFRMEPGRSLLDQAGITMAKVAYRKKDQDGNWLVGIEMNRSQLSSSSADFLLDPIFIPLQPAEKEQATPVYFTGAYCLEHDVILKRKIELPHLPEVGDVIAFPNTAGYLMHFYETQSHLLEFTPNLIADEESSIRFVEDEI